VTGILPSSAWKMRRFKQNGSPAGPLHRVAGRQRSRSCSWRTPPPLPSNGIVNKPHLVRFLEDPVTQAQPHRAARAASTCGEHLALVKSAMVDVNRFGTSRVAFAGAEYAAPARPARHR
jgi:hypothetical protein